MNASPRFLSVDDVLKLHSIAIEDQGGDATIRDRSLLESAIAMPAQQFGGNYLHDDIPAMAGAYAFHLCMNHPFVDGNKRAGTAAMIAFLSDNGWSFDATAGEAEPMILQLAAGSLNKSEFTDWARNHMHEKPKMELREFFSRIDATQFAEVFKGLLPGETGVNPRELVQRTAEAAIAIPLINSLAQQQNQAKQSGSQQDWDRITFLAVGLITLHTLAEDMGYEW